MASKHFRYSTQVLTLSKASLALRTCISHLLDAEAYEKEMAPAPGEEYDDLYKQAKELQASIQGTQDAVVAMMQMQNEEAVKRSVTRMAEETMEKVKK